MKIVWEIEEADVGKVKAFYRRQRENPFVKNRIRCNLGPERPRVTISTFWKQLVGCLLTTQQRSGPGNPVHRFTRSRPFPLLYQDCSGADDLAEHALGVFKRFGGIRRTSKISEELAANMNYLKGGGWEATRDHLEKVRTTGTAVAERNAARFLAKHFIGLGPKQSRNLLQCLGLSRHEIPIDSRITRWLNEFGFPLRLSANALSDPNYYDLVSEGFQRLCKACGIVPCVLDAAIFASYDGDAWNEENVCE